MCDPSTITATQVAPFSRQSLPDGLLVLNHCSVVAEGCFARRSILIPLQERWRLSLIGEQRHLGAARRCVVVVSAALTSRYASCSGSHCHDDHLSSSLPLFPWWSCCYKVVAVGLMTQQMPPFSCIL
jgi:hypothetical protein